MESEAVQPGGFQRSGRRGRSLLRARWQGSPHASPPGPARPPCPGRSAPLRLLFLHAAGKGPLVAAPAGVFRGRGPGGAAGACAAGRRMDVFGRLIENCKAEETEAKCYVTHFHYRCEVI